jgi:hypothetical protein
MVKPEGPRAAPSTHKTLKSGSPLGGQAGVAGKDGAGRVRPCAGADRPAKKIGDVWGITGKAYVDRTTAALRYGLLEYQGVGKERE